MPRAALWYIRLALLYLLLGFTLGALLLANKGVPLSPYLWQWLPAHIEFLLLGWTLLLALGVAFWILPRFQTTRPRTGLVWLALILLNGGVWLVALAPFMPTVNWLQLAGRMVEAGGAVAFALHAWPRVKPASSS